MLHATSDRALVHDTCDMVVAAGFGYIVFMNHSIPGLSRGLACISNNVKPQTKKKEYAHIPSIRFFGGRGWR